VKKKGKKNQEDDDSGGPGAKKGAKKPKLDEDGNPIDEDAEDLGGGAQGKDTKGKGLYEEADDFGRRHDLNLPLITQFDEKDDRKSLYRKLTNRLYLIVKKPRQKYSWQFPQTFYEEAKDKQHLRLTAKRQLESDCGPKLSTFFIGHSPIHYIQYDLPPKERSKYNNVSSTKVFYYKSLYLNGHVKLNKESLVDYNWVTKSEMKEYFEPDYYESIQGMLSDWVRKFCCIIC